MKTFLVALLLLVLGPGTASAECAWVLWEELSNPMRSLSPHDSWWEIVGTALTRQDCGNGANGALKDRADRMGAVGTVKAEGNQVSVRMADTLLVYRYLCLPDTVDPRGPKGK